MSPNRIRNFAPTSENISIANSTSKLPSNAYQQPRASSPVKSPGKSPSKTQLSKPAPYRDALGRKPILERIESGLTVDIGPDLRMVTGKEPPKFVNRAGASPKRANTKMGSYNAAANTSTRGANNRAGAKSAGKPTFKRTNTTPYEVSLHSNFGVSLGNKMFKNEVFEKRIHDV